MTRCVGALGSVTMAVLLLAATSAAEEITWVITGVPEPLLANVRSHVEDVGFGTIARVSAGQFDQITENARLRAREALKPLGFYHPVISTSVAPAGRERYRINLRIEPGPPVRVKQANIELRGDGERQEDLREWRRAWPLGEGSILNQAIWEEQKQAAMSLAHREGYLNANFITRTIELDLAANEAHLTLVLDTGTRAVFGTIDFVQDVVEPYALANVPRFAPGTPFRPDLVESLRLDLWTTGYFTDIEVEEQRQLDQTPPTVNIVASMETEWKNTYQGALGFGSDTGFRTQALWSRRPLSSRGDRIDLGIGYQEMDDQFTLRADYRIPRQVEKRQFWIANLLLRRDKQDLEVKRHEDDEDFIKLATGNVDDVFFRAGRLYVRDINEGKVRYFETMFAQYLRESFSYDPGVDADPAVLDLLRHPEFGGIFSDTVKTIALGVEWDWPAVTGSGFDITGHHERAWIFTSSDLWGSDRDFTQLYISSRRNFIRDRWKLLLRAEVGYTDAKVDRLTLDVEGEPLALSLTRLPNQYRFKAGGSNSVRGYRFEDLSDNDVGSNHIISASAEIEMRVLENWSAAAFVDIGNAFNDWNDFQLRKGAGIGIRWYTIAGPLRLDVAQALDIEGRPLRVHFTIGTPLL
ncbi:MAG TPA: BamA/TamA family outer membrane protein [Woeseiaceae bacterium]|nr:BamA/TamA family outer membrane protein [Woeseiaceae bacterium]